MSNIRKLGTTLGVMASLAVATAYLARKNNFSERLWKDEDSVALNSQRLTSNELNLIMAHFSLRKDGVNAEVEFEVLPGAQMRSSSESVEYVKEDAPNQYFGQVKGREVFIEPIIGAEPGVRACFVQELQAEPTKDSPALMAVVNIPQSEWLHDKGHSFLKLILPELIEKLDIALRTRLEVNMEKARTNSEPISR